MFTGFYIKIAFTLLFLSLNQNSAKSQCENDETLQACVGLINNYKYVKTLNIEPDLFKKGVNEIEFSYVFNKGTTYIITVCDKNATGNKLIVDVFNNLGKKVLSSYNNESKKYYLKIIFPCASTAVYRLKYSFSQGNSACGVSIIGIQSLKN